MRSQPRALLNRRSSTTSKATLSGQPWRVSLDLKLPVGGKVVDSSVRFDAMFEVEEGYEPPQGRLLPQQSASLPEELDGFKLVDTSALNRWQLSEDPDDRKDGLWIWGLFEEPLYPFCLLQLTLKDVVVGSKDGEPSEVLGPLTVFAQISHVCDRKTGQVELQTCPVTVKKMETIKVDLAGLASANIATDEPVGVVRFSPL